MVERRFSAAHLIFVFFFGILVLYSSTLMATETVWGRVVAGMVAAGGLILMITAARYVRPGWLLPILVGTAGFLEALGDRLLHLMVTRGEGLTTLLSIGLSIASAILLLVATILMIQEAFRQVRNPPSR